MKINYKNILCIILFLAVIIIFSPKSQAAGLVINFSKSTANVGDTITVTVTGQGIAGRADLTVSGPATLSESSVWVDNNSASVTANITGEGSVRITATPTSMADSTTEVAYTEPTAGTITVSSSSSSTSTSTGSSSTTSTETEESSNANLSNLGIRPNDFSGFQPGTTTYNVTVPEDVDSVEVYATAQDSSATVSGTGNQTLQYGANVLNVVVTAENGTTKTYTINVNREEAEEEETEEFKRSFMCWKEKHPFPKEQSEACVKYLERVIDARVCAIVSKQYRGSYWKAALLAASMDEVLDSMGGRSDFAYQYYLKFSNHRAFRAELRKLVKGL